MPTVPPQLKELSRSPDLYIQSEKIGGMFDLNINQIGELDAEIRDILSGASKSSDFIKHIVERLEISRGIADKITAEVNKEVFGSIREHLQRMEEEATEADVNTSGGSETVSEAHRDISTLEHAGGFSVEKPGGVDENGENAEAGGVNDDDVKPSDRGEILKNIENPPHGLERHSAKVEETFTEPLVDQLLTNPTARPEEIVSHQAPPPANLPIVEAAPEADDAPVAIPSAPPAPPKPRGPDLYREQTK